MRHLSCRAFDSAEKVSFADHKGIDTKPSTSTLSGKLNAMYKFRYDVPFPTSCLLKMRRGPLLEVPNMCCFFRDFVYPWTGRGECKQPASP